MDCPYEIVHVINATHLIDSESYQRAFEPDQAGRLQPGFYVVLWRAPGVPVRFDGSANYVGPFPTRHLAESAHAAISIGVVLPPRADVAAPALT